MVGQGPSYTWRHPETSNGGGSYYYSGAEKGQKETLTEPRSQRQNPIELAD